MAKYLNISVDTALGGNSPSDTLAVSQKAIKTYVDNHSGGGTVAIDGTTITKNGSDQIQAVATVNANTAAGATNPIYDWVGTLAEYTAQDIQNQHSDWLCYITDDNTAQAFDAYSKTESDARYVQQGHQVIEFLEPTAANNYTWYRKYADGWVEQGGKVTSITTGSVRTQTLPVTMSNEHYTVNMTLIGTGTPDTGFKIVSASTTTSVFGYIINSSDQNTGFYWTVMGMAA